MAAAALVVGAALALLLPGVTRPAGAPREAFNPETAESGDAGIVAVADA